MEAVGSRLARIAAQNVTVFVSGESGTGKEKIARAVHRLSPRCEGPFLAINVAAFPEALLEDELFGHVRGAFTGADRDRAGLFEAAHGGTIFLDEIGDLPLSLQAKLLRVLQEREIKRVGENRFRAVDVRLVSATARSLERAVEEGAFREDLYYRIKVATLALPPLRDRGADVALLARHFLDRSAAEYGKGSLKLTSAASSALRACRWPGNVRQLENTIREAVALADAGATLDRDDFSGLPAVRDDAKGSYRERVDAFRRRTVEEALARSAGNRTHAARDLGLTRQALLYLIRELGVRG
jgi:transcriptional regulator with PAS, ATPase and Fis domain